MARKVPLDKLADSIEKTLREYEASVVKDTGQLAKDFAKQGAKAVAQSARSSGWGDTTGYDKGWTTKYEEGRLSASAIIYNKDVPGLAHLLENGHAKRNGGRTRAFPHIAPVEEKITGEFYRAVLAKL